MKIALAFVILFFVLLVAPHLVLAGITAVIASSAPVVTPEITNAVHDTIANFLNLALLGLTTALGVAVRWGISRLRFSWQQSLATRLVKYAEQKFTGDEEKRKYVAAQLSAKFPRLSAEEIDHMLEEAVHNLDAGLTTVILPPPAA